LALTVNLLSAPKLRARTKAFFDHYLTTFCPRCPARGFGGLSSRKASKLATERQQNAVSIVKLRLSNP
jgi:hypothetical protein